MLWCSVASEVPLLDRQLVGQVGNDEAPTEPNDPVQLTEGRIHERDVLKNAGRDDDVEALVVVGQFVCVLKVAIVQSGVIVKCPDC